MARLRSLRKRAKAVSTYFAERREADRFQPEGWETAEGRALLSQYRAEMNAKLPAADLTRETTGPVPPRHSAEAIARDTNHRPRHDGTQSQVDPSYLLTRPAAARHGTPGPARLTGLAGTARVLTIANVVRGPAGDPLAGAIVTITLVADHDMPGFQPHYKVAEVTGRWPDGRLLARTPARPDEPAA